MTSGVRPFLGFEEADALWTKLWERPLAGRSENLAPLSGG